MIAVFKGAEILKGFPPGCAITGDPLTSGYVTTRISTKDGYVIAYRTNAGAHRKAVRTGQDEALRERAVAEFEAWQGENTPKPKKASRNAAERDDDAN